MKYFLCLAIAAVVFTGCKDDDNGGSTTQITIDKIFLENINDEVNKQVRVHKNGTKYQTLDYSQEVYLYYATGDQRPFWVNGSGDVYLSLLENGSLYRIYKNGKNLYSTDNSGTVSFQPFCVIE